MRAGDVDRERQGGVQGQSGGQARCGTCRAAAGGDVEGEWRAAGGPQGAG